MIATDPSGFIALIVLYLVLKFAFTVSLLLFFHSRKSHQKQIDRSMYGFPFFATTSSTHFQFNKAFVQFFKQKIELPMVMCVCLLVRSNNTSIDETE